MRAGLAAAALALACAGGSEARAGGPATYRGLPTLDRAELRAIRGGLTVLGHQVEFGALHTVSVGGSIVAQTVFNLAEDGTLSRDLTIFDESLVSEFGGSGNPAMGIRCAG